MVRRALPIPVPELPPLPLHPLQICKRPRVHLQRYNLRMQPFRSMPQQALLTLNNQKQHQPQPNDTQSNPAENSQ